MCLAVGLLWSCVLIGSLGKRLCHFKLLGYLEKHDDMMLLETCKCQGLHIYIKDLLGTKPAHATSLGSVFLRGVALF